MMSGNRGSAEKHGLGRVLALGGAGMGALAAGVAFAVVSALAEVVPYYAVYRVLLDVAGHAGADAVLAGTDAATWALVAAMGALVSLACGFISSMCCHGYAFKSIHGIRMALVRHLRALPLGRFRTVPSGATMQVLGADVDQLEGFLAHQLPDLVSTLALIVALVAVMLARDVALALVVLGVIVIGFAAMFAPMMKLLKEGAMQRNFDALERINAASTEYVHGMPSVKMFGQTPRTFAGFQRDILGYRDFTVGMSRRMVPGMVLFRTLVLSVATFVAPVAVALFSARGADVVPTAVFFLVFAPAASMPVIKVRTLSEGVNMLGECVSRIEGVLDEQPLAVAPAENPAHTGDAGVGAEGACGAACAVPTEKPVRTGGSSDGAPAAAAGSATSAEKSVHAVDVGAEAPAVAFEGVSFAYGDGRFALRDASFAVPQGSLVALVGASGAGKSTAASLMCRFWDATEGRVRLFGCDVRELTEAELMGMVAFVFQRNHIFHATVAENIRMARPDATDEEVRAAARAARCDGFVSALPQGLDTLVGEGGAGLSGGERQRIAIARAYLKDAPLLVLDEPTASMDADVEYEVQQALAELARGKTVVMVAHRLNTVVNADCILMFEDGRIVERGAHDELLRAQGAYARLWEASQEARTWQLASGACGGSARAADGEGGVPAHAGGTGFSVGDKVEGGSR